MKNRNQGFTLFELVVASAIITTAAGWAIPNYLRTLKQGEVDRYSKAIEVGFFTLQENLKSARTTCKLKFDQSNTWLPANQVLEFGTSSIGINNPERLSCCNSQLKEVTGEECPNIQTIQNHPNVNDLLKSIRFLRLQNTPDSKTVEVAILSSNGICPNQGDSKKVCYTMPPPGTSAETNPIFFIVRSLSSQNNPKIKARCIKVIGSSSVNWGTLNGTLDSNNCTFEDE